MGWCVRQGDIDALRTAFRLSSILWGGRFNPVIPVDDPTLASQLSDLFHVDALYAVKPDSLVDEFIAARPHISWPRFMGPLLLSAFDLMRQTASTQPLDTGFVMTRMDEHKPPEDQTLIEFGPLPKWSATDPLGLALTATFGEFPDDAWGEPLEWRFTALRGKERRVLEPNEVIPATMLGHVGPLSLTEWGLYPLRGGVMRGGGVFVGDAGSYDDLVEFWNLNAAGHGLWFYDPSHADRQAEMLNGYLTWVDRRVDTLPETSQRRYLNIWSRGSVEIAVSSRIDVMRHNISRTQWNGLNVKVPYMTTLGHTVVGAVATEHHKPTLTFQPERDTAFDLEETKGQYVIMDVRAHHTGVEEDGFTFAAPNLPELNEYFGYALLLDRDKVRIGPDGIGFITRIEKTYYKLRALPTGELFERIFAAFGMEARPSRAGLIAKRLIRQMGGLQSCRVFKIQGVRNLIESYGPTQAFTRGQALQQIQPAFTQYESLYITSRETPKLTTEDAFLFLLDNGVFRAGLEFTCPNCELDFWLLLDDAKTWVDCEYCGARFNSTTQLRDKNGWRYRRSGLFGRDNHQEGSIPVSLALQRLDTSIDRTMDTTLYTTALTIRPTNADVPECEIDFVFLSHLANGRVQLAIGEAKAAAEIEVKDVQNLRAIASAFPRSRLDVYPTFAKSGSFSREELQRCLDDSDPHEPRQILFSRAELEPYDLHERLAGLEHRLQYEASLSALADGTTRLYRKEVSPGATAPLPVRPVHPDTAANADPTPRSSA